MNWIKLRKKQVDDLSSYINHLEDNLRDATSILSDLSVGLVPSDMPDNWSHATKMQSSAARCLRKLSLKAYQRPSLWW